MKQTGEAFIEELKVYTPNNINNLFSENVRYIIPLYQRAFSWEDKEINQLMEDIDGIADDTDSSYCLGSLIVYKLDDEYEVIDGQQRLTTLFLVLKYLLDWKNCEYLTFAYRPTSDNTLDTIGAQDNLLKEKDEGIIKGWDIISEYFKKHDKEKFKEKLSKVKIYRIKVPPHTDLNRYFEIMNTRGEQLEQQDILKAHLMDCLNDNEKDIFALIWDACVNMNGYIQMHFTPEYRASIFGETWTEKPKNEYNKFIRAESGEEKKKILDIINFDSIQKLQEANNYGEDDDGSQRFRSIIEAPYFLMHVLKVFLNQEIKSHGDTKRLLDDKKLFETFEAVIKKYYNGQKRVFSLKFINYLLTCRYLFDKYIIKRETSGTDEEGVWSLKCLCSSGQQSKKKAYYKNTCFANLWEREKTYDERHKQILMLQACLRVSYTSPKIMHWITELLIWLYNNNNNIVDVGTFLEKYIAKAVYQDYFNNNSNLSDEDYLKAEAFNAGVDTPHIVFNYLDYLLWNKYKKAEENYKNFTFEYRNSVEHWYPQHPSEGTFESWSPKDGLDYFGNLCLVQRRTNSKFSNLSPESKKGSFGDTIKNGSLKLRIMSNETITNADWKENAYKKHGREMLEILRENVVRLISNNDN